MDAARCDEHAVAVAVCEPPPGSSRRRGDAHGPGRHVLKTYRDLQLQLELLLDSAGDPFLPIQ